MKSLLFFILLLINGIGLCQDSLVVNQYNSNGDKIGLWEQRLDERLCPTESDDYSYIVYNRYDVDGRVIYEHQCHNWYNRKLILRIMDSSYTSNNKLISGNFYNIDENENIVYQEIYKDGFPVKFSENDFSFKQTIYFDTLWQGQIGSHLVKYSNYSQWYKNDYKGWHEYAFDDTINNLKYPYFVDTPPLLAVLVGYNFLNDNELELGVIFNQEDLVGFKYGSMIGESLIYRRSLNRNLNAIDFDIGWYMPFTFGFGMNSNFNNQSHLLGFKLFAGTTFYHTQLIYGYNFFRNSKNDILNINHHSLRLRIAIPVKKVGYNYQD